MDEARQPADRLDDAETPAPTAEEVAAEVAAVAHVAAADPARDAEPDTAALRTAVAARRLSSPPDELAARRLRRLTTWPARAAAVAAAALVVGGGGGYAIGAAGDGGDGGHLADAPITLQAPGNGMASAGGAGESLSAPESAADEQFLAAAAGGDARVDADMGYGWYGRTVFHSSGLSGDAGTAQAWALDATGVVSAEAAARAAAALGVAGDPRQEYGAWVVGPNDGSGATVQVYADGAGSVSYWDPAKDTWYCDASAVPEEAAPEGDVDAPDGAGVGPVPDPCGQRDLGNAPSGDTAAGTLKDAMTALGVDVSAYQFTAPEDDDPSYTYVTARHVLAGQQTGLTWSASFSGAGMTSLYGFTATVVDLGQYGVVSPTEAVERLNDPRFGGGWSGPIMMADAVGAREGGDLAVEPDGDTATAPADEPDGVPPSPAAPGAAISWPVQDVTIVSSRLGVAQATVRGGAVVLVPTYELTAEDGSAWSVIAVDEAHLDLSVG